MVAAGLKMIKEARQPEPGLHPHHDPPDPVAGATLVVTGLGVAA
jgi:hypothetical protein